MAAPRWSRRTAVALLSAAVLGAAVGCDGPRPDPPTTTDTPTPSDAPPTPVGRPTPAPEDRTVTVARHGAVELVVPSAYALLVGLHESDGAEALELEVLAPVAADHAGAGVAAEPADDEDVTVIVLPGRRRGTDPTTAMDVVVPAGRAIVSPLDGTVTAVEDYVLYGRHRDRRIVIRAAADPAVEAVLLHVEDVTVVPGERVRAGETVVAGSARVLPEESQIDRYSRRSVREDAPPHVHVELHLR